MDTPIERFTGYASSLRISVGDSLWSYSVAIRVNRVVLVGVWEETIKPMLMETKSDSCVWKEMHQFNSNCIL